MRHFRTRRSPRPARSAVDSQAMAARSEAVLKASPSSVGSAARLGARQGLVAQGLLQAGSIVTTVVLARLLTPSAFGIVALAQSVLALVQIFSVSSFGLAVITANERVRERAATFFWLTTAIGLCGAGAIALLAGPIARLLGQPDAARFVAAVGVSLVFELAAIVPQAMLRRTMQFRLFFRSQLLAAAVYFVVQISLAASGFGAWAVILGQIAMSVVGCLSSVVLARWVPERTFDFSLVREDLPFTSTQTVAQVLVYVQKNCDYWVVSSLLGGPALGIYYVAYVLPNILRQRITWVAQVVLIPAFAQIQKAGGDLTTAWRTVWVLQAGLGLPALVGVVVLAEPVVLTFFGHQWTDTIPVIRILGISALLNLHMTSVGVVATANRKTLQFVYVAAIRTGLTLVAVLIAGIAFHSLVAIASGVVTASIVAAVVQEHFLAAPLGIGMKSISGLTLRVLLPALLMGATLVAVDSGVSAMPPWLRLVIGVVIGSLTYFGIGLLLFRTTFRSLLSSSRRLLIPR